MRKLLLLLMLLILLTLPLAARAEVVLSADIPEDWHDREVMRITVLETARADAILVECGGQAMLIDGAHQAFSRAVKFDLESRNLTSFKYFLNTHPHNDHIEGLTALMDWGVKPERFLSPLSADDNSDSYHVAAVKSAWKAGVIFRRVKNGQTYDVGGAQVHILMDEKGVSLNDKGIVPRIVFGNTSILLAADLTAEGQRAHLALHEALLKADIVKAPHHGENAMVPEFLDAVSPSLLLCTAPRDEAPALVNQAAARSLPALFSGDGAIVLETDGETWYVYQLPKQGVNRWKK